MIQDQNHPRLIGDDLKVLRAIVRLQRALNHPIFKMMLREYYCEKIILPAAGKGRSLHEVKEIVIRWFEIRSNAMHQALQVWGLHNPQHTIRKKAYADQEKILGQAYTRIFDEAWNRKTVQSKILQAIKKERIGTFPIFTYLRGREFEHRLYPAFTEAGHVKPDPNTITKLNNGRLRHEDIIDLAEKVEGIARVWPFGKPLAFQLVA